MINPVNVGNIRNHLFFRRVVGYRAGRGQLLADLLVVLGGDAA